MKTMKKSLSAVLVLVMLISSICVSTAFAASVQVAGGTEIEQSLSYDFNDGAEVPGIFRLTNTKNASAVVENQEFKVTTKANATESLLIDVNDFAGASRKKGVLTYTFDYKADTELVNTRIMVGSNSTARGNSLATIQQKNIIDHTADGAVGTWYAVSGAGADVYQKVMVQFDFSTETVRCSMGNKSFEHKFSYYNDMVVSGEAPYVFSEASKFLLYFRTNHNADYTYYIDNFKVSYTERGAYEKAAVEEFDDNTISTAITTSGAKLEKSASEETGTVTALNGRDNLLYYKPELTLGKANKKGVVTYKFDMKKPDKAIRLGLGDTKNSIVNLGVFSSTGLYVNAANKTFNYGGSGDWCTVTVTVDFAKNIVTANVGGADTYTYNLTEADLAKNLLCLQTYIWINSGEPDWIYYIDNVSAVYTERPFSEATVVEEFNDDTVEAYISVSHKNGATIDGLTVENTIGKVTNAVKNDTLFYIKPDLTQAKAKEMGILTYKFDYNLDREDKSIPLRVGEYGSANSVVIGELKNNGLNAGGKLYAGVGTEWHSVEVAVDFVKNEIRTNVDGGEAYTVALTETDLAKDLFIFHTRVWTGEFAEDGAANTDWSFYIDNVSAEYTEISPKATSLSGVNSDNVEYKILDAASDARVIKVKLNTPVEKSVFDAGVKLYSVGADRTEAEVAFTTEYDEASYTYTLTAALDESGRYKLYIKDLKSTSGIIMELDEIYTFNTGNDVLFTVNDTKLQYKTDGAYADVESIDNIKSATAVKGVADVTNSTFEPENMKYLFAVYQDGVLINVQIEDVKASETGSVEKEFNVSDADKADKVALFVWNDTMAKPMGAAFVIPTP